MAFFARSHRSEVKSFTVVANPKPQASLILNLDPQFDGIGMSARVPHSLIADSIDLVACDWVQVALRPDG